jgi:hypothetical protein
MSLTVVDGGDFEIRDTRTEESAAGGYVLADCTALHERLVAAGTRSRLREDTRLAVRCPISDSCTLVDSAGDARPVRVASG